MTRLHALLLCSLLVPACDSAADSSTPAKAEAKSEGKSDGKSDGKSESKAVATADAKSVPAGGSSAAAPAADGPKFGEGPVIDAMTLAKLDLPKMTGFDKANWSAVEAEKDGLRKTVLKEGDTMYVSIDFFDCNLPKMKEVATKPVDERGDWEMCFVAPAADAAKVKNYPRMDTAEYPQSVAIKVGHVMVHAGVFEGQKDKIKKQDLAAYLETVDFSSIEK